MKYDVTLTFNKPTDDERLSPEALVLLAKQLADRYGAPFVLRQNNADGSIEFRVKGVEVEMGEVPE